MNTHHLTPHAERARWKALALVLGLAALLILIAGGAILAADSSHRDAAGFYSTGAEHVATPGNALVSSDLDLEMDGAGWLFRDGRVGTVRVAATGTRSRPIFVGIAPRAKVAAYLNGVARDEVTDFEVRPLRLEKAGRPGSRTPDAPGTESFWTKSVAGVGRQTLTWPLESGTWGIVVMNADGSKGISTDLTLGAKVPAAFWVGGILVTFGGALLLGSAALALRALLRRRRAAATAAALRVAPGSPSR